MLHPDRMVEVSAMSAAAMALAAATSSSSSSSPPPPPPSYKLISISSSQSIPRNADHHHAPSHGLASTSHLPPPSPAALLASPVSFHLLANESSTARDSFEDVNDVEADDDDGTSVISEGLSPYDKLLLDLALRGVLHLKHTKMKEQRGKTLSKKQEKWLKFLVDGPEKERVIKTLEERGIRHVQSFAGNVLDEKLWEQTREQKNKSEERKKPWKQRLVALLKRFYHWVVDSKQKKRSRLKPKIAFREEWAEAAILVHGKVSVLKPGSKHLAWRSGVGYLFDCGWLVCFKRASHFKTRRRAVYAIPVALSRLSFVPQPLDPPLAAKKKFLLRVEDSKSADVLLLSTGHAGSRDVWYKKTLELRERLQAEAAAEAEATRIKGEEDEDEDEDEDEEEETNLQFLLRMQADPNCTGPHGLTPLHFAAKNGNTK